MDVAVILLLTCLLFITLDIPYLFVFGERWKGLVATVQKTPMQVNFGYGLIVYVILAVGLYGLVLSRNMTLKETIVSSALLGLSTYGVFNFTNSAIFKEYDMSVAVVDTAWGTLLTSVVGASVYSFINR